MSACESRSTCQPSPTLLLMLLPTIRALEPLLTITPIALF
jgi:hypothetical protein